MQFKLHIHVKQGFNYVKNALYSFELLKEYLRS